MKRTIKSFLLILVFLCLGVHSLAQENDEKSTGKQYFLNLSLYYPVSLNKTKHDRVNLNLTLLSSRVGYVSGLDLSFVASAISYRLQGVQVCGLFGVVGESGQGMQTSGLINICGEQFTGFQAAGLMNIVGEDLSGFQSSGLFNITGKHGTGFQAAGLFNIAGEDFSGFQVGGGFNIIGGRGSGFQAVGLFNVAGEDFKGIQAAGLFNVTGEVLNGLQWGTFNVAAHSEGLQVGLVNIAGTCDGAQIGLVNYTKKENTGLPIGPVNLAENGYIRGIFWGENDVAVAAGVKFIINRMYSIVSLGAGNPYDSITESLTYGFHYGVLFSVERLGLSVDLGYRYRDNKALFRRCVQNPDQHILELRVLMGIPLSDNLTLMLGTGLAHVFNCGKHINTGEVIPLFIAGFEFF